MSGVMGTGPQNKGLTRAAMLVAAGVGAVVLFYSTAQREHLRATERPRVADAPAAGTAARVARRPTEASARAHLQGQDARISGIVQSTIGGPLARANVCVVPARDACCASAVCASSDGAGRFSLDAPSVSSIIVIAAAQGHLPLRRPLTRIPPDAPLVLSLEPGGVQVTGSVADASGGPVVDALVSATRTGEPLVALAATASTGKFVLTVPAGRIELSARADGYSSMIRQVDAPTDDLELILTPSSSVRGSVLVEETEEPVAGIEVTAFNANGLGVGSRTATTDERGAFEIPELPAGGYWVDASSAGWRSARRWVVLEVAEQETLDLLVSPATRVTATVRAAGAPCQRGFVTLTRLPESSFRELDESGGVEFLGVLPGRYDAQASCDPGMELREEIEVGLEPVVREWDLDQGLSLTGTVTTQDGAPLGGARVDVTPIGEPGSRRGVACESNERGAFSCFGLEPGEYAAQLRENVAGESVRVTLGEGSAPPQVVLRASATATLSVRLEGAEGLALDAFAVVAARKGTGPVAANRQGTEFIFEKLPLGVYEVMLDPEIPGGRQEVELARAGAVVELSLTAPSARSLSGRVVDDSGNGVPDAWVRVSGTSLEGELHPASPVMTDAEGAFTVPGLLAGTYELTATSDRGEARMQEVVNDGRSVIVPLRSYGSVSGSVTESDGTPVRDFVVTYSQQNAGSPHRVSGRQGEWSLPWLPPGAYELTVLAPQGNARATIEVAPGHASTVALSLGPSPLEARESGPPR